MKRYYVLDEINEGTEVLAQKEYNLKKSDDKCYICIEINLNESENIDFWSMNNLINMELYKKLGVDSNPLNWCNIKEVFNLNSISYQLTENDYLNIEFDILEKDNEDLEESFIKITEISLI